MVMRIIQLLIGVTLLQTGSVKADLDFDELDLGDVVLGGTGLALSGGVLRFTWKRTDSPLKGIDWTRPVPKVTVEYANSYTIDEAIPTLDEGKRFYVEVLEKPPKWQKNFRLLRIIDESTERHILIDPKSLDNMSLKQKITKEANGKPILKIYQNPKALNRAVRIIGLGSVALAVYNALPTEKANAAANTQKKGFGGGKKIPSNNPEAEQKRTAETAY